MSNTPLYGTEDHAHQFAEWLKSRGGLLVWKSHDLSDPGASCTTPALTDGKPTTSPHWKYTANPARHITDAADVRVTVNEPVKTIKIKLQQRGMRMELTKGSSHRVRQAIESAGEGAFYKFGAGDDNTARCLNALTLGEDTVTIYREKAQLPLTEWLATHPK